MPKFLKRILIAILACYVIICGVIWLLSPLITTHFLSPFLADNNLNLKEESTFRYNPFISKVSVTTLNIARTDDPTSTNVLSLNSAELEVSLWGLLSKTLHVSQFDIKGLEVDINKSDDLLQIAGWALPTEAAAPEPMEQEEQTLDSEYKISIPSITIINSMLNLNWLGNKHTLNLDEIKLNQLKLNASQQQGNVALKLILNNSPIQLDAEFGLNNPLSELHYSLSINQLDLAKFNHFIYPDATKTSDALLSGLLSVNYTQDIQINDTNLKTQLSNLDISLSKLVARVQNSHIAIDNQTLTSRLLSLGIDDWSLETPKIDLNSEASFQLSDLNAYTTENHLSLAKINQISIPEIGITTVESKQQFTLPNISIDEANFSDNTQDKTRSLGHFKSLNILDIKLSEDGVSIDTIDLLGLGVDLKKTAEGKLAGLIEAKTSSTASQEESITQTPPTEANSNLVETSGKEEVPAKEFAIALNQFTLTDSDSFNFVDESVKPKLEHVIKLEQLTLGPANNQTPDELTLLKLTGKSNKYASFDFDAESKPFSTVPYYKLNGLFKEVNLPDISTYIKDALAYEFDSGQLDVNIDVTVVDTDIKGETKIMLRGLELGAANNPDDEMLASSTSIPFNYALGMLKDSDGNVELDIPLKGKTTDPDFSIQGFVTLLVKRATMSAAQDYLITTFVPYANIVKVSMIAGDYLLKVRFNDLPFTTGDINLSESATPFLQQFSTLMKEKEDTQLTICAFSIPKDIGIEDLSLKLNDDQYTQLKALSLARMNSFKDHMVNNEGLDSSRLLLCTPKVDKSEDAIARLTFTD